MLGKSLIKSSNTRTAHSCVQSDVSSLFAAYTVPTQMADGQKECEVMRNMCSGTAAGVWLPHRGQHLKDTQAPQLATLLTTHHPGPISAQSRAVVQVELLVQAARIAVALVVADQLVADVNAVHARRARDVPHDVGVGLGADGELGDALDDVGLVDHPLLGGVCRGVRVRAAAGELFGGKGWGLGKLLGSAGRCQG